MQILRKLGILADSVIGYFIKWKYDLFGVPAASSDNSKIDVVVSLTSYGRRVEKGVVYYTILSLLNQSVRPTKIILWLDDSWSLNTLPKRLKKLLEYNVEIKFCNDVKSYKKLIPTLKEYPDSLIITVDDDVIYSKYLVENLIAGYYTDGNIQCTNASIPHRIGNSFSKYNDWPSVRELISGQRIVPIGVGGVLYPPHSLSDEVLNENDFMRLAPQADDLWFWVMAVRKGSKHSFVKLRGKSYSFDNIYQYFHKGSALTHSNAKQSKNDIQLKNILNDYPI